MELFTKQILPLKGVVYLILCVAIYFFFASCSEETTNNEPETPSNFDEFAQTLPNWETFSPQLPEADEPTGDTDTLGTETIDSVEYNVTSTLYSLSTTPQSMTTLNPDVEILWVGSLLQGDGYKGGLGSLAELPIRQRTPLELSINLLYSDNTRTIVNPTVATVSQAVGELISGADAAGHKAGSSIFYNYSLTHSIKQAMLKVGVSANFTTANVKASLEANLSEEKRTVTAYFVHNMFSVSMVLPQNPKDVFSNEFTQELLEREISLGRMGPNNPPVYVSSITYGRILIFTFTSTSSEANITATLNAIYNGGAGGGGVELEGKYKQVLENAEIQVVTVGGDAAHALALIRSNNLGEFFSSDAAITTAKPLSYTIRNLKDNSIAKVSETTAYDLREYTPVLPGGPTGAKYAINFTFIKAKTLVPGINRTARIRYKFNVDDSHMAPQPVATNENENQIFKQGEKFSALNPQPGYVEIHFDGEDKVEIFTGYMEDRGFVGANRTYYFDKDHNAPITYQWPTRKLPLHDLEIDGGRTITLYDGNEWQFLWTIKRVDWLYD